MLAVGVSSDAAGVGGAVGDQQGHAAAGLDHGLGGVDRGADGGGAQLRHGAGAGIEEELRGVQIVGEGALLRRGSGWVEVSEDDTLAKIAGADLAELGELECDVGRSG
jgi:hypothetical protein